MALGFMRRHRRWLFVFLWLVILAFIVLYVPEFQGADEGAPGETLARVGDLPITAGEFQRAYVRQRQRMQQLYGGELDPAMLERLGLREQVLSSLVDQRLVLLEAERLGITVDDQALTRALTQSPAFQQDGRFMGAAEIRRRLELQGVSEREFEESLRSQILAERLRSLVTDVVAVTPQEAEREFRRRNEQVKAEYVLVPADRFQPQVAVADEEVKARYEARKEDYRVPEKRVVSYLLVDAGALQARAAVTDPEIQVYYQDHADEFREEEQACASHILVKVAAAPGAGEGHPDDKARRRALSALEQARAGAEFGALARKVSEDAGSASQGGDLGCFPRGRMVPEFDNVAFSLEPGEVSDLVKTSFGYHVIKLNSRREETLPALSQVKDRVRQILVSQKASALVADKVQAISAALARGRGLDEVGAAEGLPVQKSAAFARGETPGVLDSPLAVARAFQLERGSVEPEPFPVGSGYAFIGYPEIQPSRLPPLDEVHDKVGADVVHDKALARAQQTASELLSRARKQGLEAAASALGLARKETPGLVGRGQPLGELGASRAVEEAAFSLPERALSEPVRTARGYAVLRLLEKKAFDPEAFEAQKGRLVAELREQKQEQLFRSYMTDARKRYRVERRPAAIQRVLG